MSRRIGALYEEAVAELAQIDAYRQRLIGRCDLLRELVAGGLGEMPVATPDGRAQGPDAAPLPRQEAVSVQETQGG